MSRPFMSNDHLRSLAGPIAVSPNHATDIHFDIAWSNHSPACKPEGEHGSHVLGIGHGVTIRAIGNAQYGDGIWFVGRHMTAAQYPSGRDLTPAQDERARAVIGVLITDWASTRAGDIAQADDIYRNNAARTLEEHIARHEAALGLLRCELSACEEGIAFTQYPDLPTDR